MSGPKAYAGKTPKSAHAHMVISGELFDLRSQFLSDSIKEIEIREDWMVVDATLSGR